MHAYRNLPALLINSDGTPCGSAETWERVRRPELLDLISNELYGYFPKEPYATTFTTGDHGVVNAAVEGPRGTFRFPFRIACPRRDHTASARCGAIVHLDWKPELFRRPYNPDAAILDNGYASVSYYPADLDPERGRENSILSIFPDTGKPNACRTIGAWAMGAFIIMDYLSSQAYIDIDKTAIVGHSRYGKTALLIGAHDTRYKLVGSIQSGHGGASLARATDGERVADMTKAFQWTCENYSAWAGREDGMPFDAHMLLALVAPRFLYVGSAWKDKWSDPEAERLSSELCQPVWKLYGKADAVGYHVRDGRHEFNENDWKSFLAFAIGKLG